MTAPHKDKGLSEINEEVAQTSTSPVMHAAAILTLNSASTSSDLTTILSAQFSNLINWNRIHAW